MFQQKGIACDDYVCPDFYGHIQAAKYLGVSPWDLITNSVYWRDRALICMTAENQAAEIVKQHQ